MALNIFRRPVNSVQAIQRESLEDKLDSQAKQLASLRVLAEDLKEIKNLKTQADTNQKEIDNLLAEIAGLNK